jgi:hypothetical protein
VGRWGWHGRLGDWRIGGLADWRIGGLGGVEDKGANAEERDRGGRRSIRALHV